VIRFHALKLVVLAVVLAGIGLLNGGCTAFGRALLPQLPAAELRVKPAVSCSEFAALVAASGPLAAPQLMALYGACEKLQGGMTIDPEGARRALGVGELIQGVQ
jgi:hypothetical protein